MRTPGRSERSEAALRWGGRGEEQGSCCNYLKNCNLKVSKSRDSASCGFDVKDSRL